MQFGVSGSSKNSHIHPTQDAPEAAIPTTASIYEQVFKILFFTFSLLSPLLFKY